MAKKSEVETLLNIPVACTCAWEKRIVLVRDDAGNRIEEAQAQHVWISPTCPEHKGKE
jgi:hypothetical protein